MHPLRRRRLFLIAVSLLVLGIGVACILYAFNQHIDLFLTPSELKARTMPSQQTFRLGGMVQRGSVRHGKDHLSVTFTVTDMSQSVVVHYRGILPDLFKPGAGVVVGGTLLPSGEVAATEVLAKHDEKYMPPNLKTKPQAGS